MVRSRDCCVALTAFMLTAAVGAQSPVPPASPARFVAASIKPFESGGQRPGRAAPDQYLRVATLSAFLQEAFDLPPFLMDGLPDWANERWEISAKAEGPPRREQMRSLLRALLEDRFALKVHIERQEQAIYELVPSRADGQRDPRLKPATGVCDPFTNGTRPFSESPVDRYGLSMCLGGTLGVGDRIAVQLYNYGMQQFANALRSYARRSVVDKTGFPGSFDFVFDFGVGNGDVPGLDTALRESLGLKLQSARGMVDVLVIDSVERPTPN